MADRYARISLGVLRHTAAITYMQSPVLTYDHGPTGKGKLLWRIWISYDADFQQGTYVELLPNGKYRKKKV